MEKTKLFLLASLLGISIFVQGQSIKEQIELSKVSNLKTFVYAGVWKYDNKFSHGYLEFYPETDSTLLFYFSVYTEAGHESDLINRISISNNFGTLVLKNDGESECKISFNFINNKCVVSTDGNSNCLNFFTAGTSIEGTYLNTSKDIPLFINKGKLHYSSIKNIQDFSIIDYSKDEIEEKKPNIAEDIKVESDTIYEVKDVNTAPSFIGGTSALMEFISSNVRYSSLARENGLEGNVYVKFYIDIDGSIKDPVVIKDKVGGGSDYEAIRVCKKMPNWNPGILNGKTVRVHYTLPVKFSLNK